MQTLRHQYNEVSSQDNTLEILKRNKGYFQPLGKMKPSQVKKASGILDKIKSLLESNDNGDKEKLADLSNQFYTLIPSHDQTRLPPITTKVLLEEKYTLLKSFQK